MKKDYTKEDFIAMLDRVGTIHTARNKSIMEQLGQLTTEIQQIALLRGSIMALPDNFILPEETVKVLDELEQAADFMEAQSGPKDKK